MKNMSFGKKMTVSMISFVMPICILAYMMFNVQTEGINFASLERDGNTYQRPLEKVLKAVSLHKIYAQRVAMGHAESRAKLDSLVSEADQGFSDLKSVNERLGQQLDFTPEGLKKRSREGSDYQTLYSQWGKLKGDSNLSVDDLIGAHDKLISGLRTMITHLGDTSNLILDPDLDSYYLMDITLGALPQTQDRLQDILSQGEYILGKNSLTPAERIQFAVYAAMLKDSDLARIAGDFQTSINEDAAFYEVSESLQKNLPPAFKSYQVAAEAFQKLLEKISISQDFNVSLQEFRTLGHNNLEAAYSVWDTSSVELDVLLKKRISVLSKGRTINLVIVFFVLFLSCGFSIHNSRSLTKTITEVTRSLASSERRVQGSSQQLTSAGSSLSESSTEAAASLEETVASLEELTSMVRLNSDNATEAASLSSSARESAVTGEKEILNLISSMNGISQSSKKIEEIIQVIDDIAFQTNLLALNAAVEAARAGEQGKGFAVVAEAVRTLAQRSAASAKDIASLIKDSVEQIENGSSIADRSGEVLNQIVTSIKKVSSLNTDIASANVEQASGIEQIGKAMNQLDQAGQTNAASAEEIAAASEALLAESKSMHSHVMRLEKVIGFTSANKNTDETI